AGVQSSQSCSHQGKNLLKRYWRPQITLYYDENCPGSAALRECSPETIWRNRANCFLFNCRTCAGRTRGNAFCERRLDDPDEACARPPRGIAPRSRLPRSMRPACLNVGVGIECAADLRHVSC